MELVPDGVATHETPKRSLDQRVAGAMATLRKWPWFDTLRTLRRRFREDRLGLTASSLTFTTLIALVPLLTVMLAVFTAFPMFANFESALEKYFLQNLVPDNIARPVMRSLTQFAAKARGMGALGLILLVATALALVLTIDRTLNAIWRVRRPRPLAQRILVYWAGMTLGPLALGVSLSLTSYAVSASRGVVGRLPGGVSLLLDAVQFAMLAATAAAMFHFVPNTVVRWRHAWAGGLFVAFGFELAKKALAWYVDSVPTYSVVYGAFATAPIFLLWIYLGWVIVLLGAVIAAYAPSLQMRVGSMPASPGWRFELALALLQALAAARGAPERGMSLAMLAQRLRLDPLQLEPVLEWLEKAGWVGRLDEPAGVPLEPGGPAPGPRHVLLCDPAATPIAPLVEGLLLASGAASTAFKRAAGFEGLLLVDAIGPARS